MPHYRNNSKTNIEIVGDDKIDTSVINQCRTKSQCSSTSLIKKKMGNLVYRITFISLLIWPESQL
jgi:hypothetical protein